MIEAFFYGEKKLMGIYHPPSDLSSDRLLVICPPLFDEYRRCYKALADLAHACSLRGLHVLRFDYFGTGESFGLLSDVHHVKQWLEDIDTSIEEGCALSGADKVTMLGVRFGATLCAQSQHPAIDTYVYWDPIEQGQNYVQWLSTVDELLTQEHTELAQFVDYRGKTEQLVQFELNPSLRDSLATLNMDNTLRDSLNYHCVTTSAAQAKSATLLNCEHSGFEYNWPMYEDGLLRPRAVLETLTEKIIA